MNNSFAKVYSGKKVLVTGNTGFKGSWLSVWLNMLGAKVYGLSLDVPTTPSVFEVLELDKKLDHTFADIRDTARMKEIFHAIKPDFVFHLAAQPIVRTSYTDPVLTYTSNVVGTMNILEALRGLTNPCHAVIITSDKCYENVEWTWGYRENDRLGGKDPYSASKAAAENVIYSYYHSFFKDSPYIKLCSARAGNVIGGGDWASNRIVPDAMRAWSNNQPLTIRSPKATRPWQHVMEPLSGYLNLGQALVEMPANVNGESFNLGPNSDQNHSVLELLQSLAGNWKIDTEKMIVIEPNEFHEAGLLKLSVDKALHTMGWKPVLNFEETVKFTSDWYYRFYYDKNLTLEFMEQQIKEYSAKAQQKGLPWIKS